jgi:hypothetical protein
LSSILGMRSCKVGDHRTGSPARSCSCSSCDSAQVELRPVSAWAFGGLTGCKGLRLFLAPCVGTGDSSLNVAVLLRDGRCLLVRTPLSAGV